MSVPEPHPDDVSLLRRLGRIVDVVDPVPEEVVEAGRAAFELYRRDVDVMRMVALDQELSAVRTSASTSRMHFFELGTVTLDVEVTVRGALCSIVGVVSDESGTRLSAATLETASATFSTAVDDDGRFAIAKVPDGLMRITLEREDGSRLTTPWFDAS